jgi:hypothetical protein
MVERRMTEFLFLLPVMIAVALFWYVIFCVPYV